MRTKVVVGLKPDTEIQPLIDLTRSVIDPPGQIALVSFVTIGTQNDELERIELVKTEIEETAEQLRQAGYAVSIEVQVASSVGVGTDLAQMAESLDADLLVIGMAKRSRVGKALLGSDAQSALMHATCPVLAMRLPN